MHKYGLKLWTTNEKWFERASQAFAEKHFDFIEIAIKSDVENTLKAIAHIPLSFHLALDDETHLIFMPHQLKENSVSMKIGDLPNNLCFDTSKGITSAYCQDIKWEDYLDEVFKKKPFYFHLSGAPKTDEKKFYAPKSAHLNLWESEKEIREFKKRLPDDCYLVFESEKDETGVNNDLKNMDWFRQL